MTEHEDEGVEETPETTEMAAILRSLPDVSMPDDVWNRLATALSAEAAPQVAAITSAPSVQRRRRWVPGAVAAGAAIVATGVLLPTIVNSGANVADAPKEASGALHMEPVTLDTVPARYVVSTGTNYSESSMPNQVSGLLGQVGVDTTAELVAPLSAAPPAPMPKSGAAPDMTTDLTSLHDCVLALAGAADLPPALVVDRGTFRGVPAAVVVFLHGITGSGSSSHATVDVIIVRPSCTEADRKAAERMTFEVSGVAP